MVNRHRGLVSVTSSPRRLAPRTWHAEHSLVLQKQPAPGTDLVGHYQTKTEAEDGGDGIGRRR